MTRQQETNERPVDPDRNDRDLDHHRDDVRGQDFGWRGTELDRGFGSDTRDVNRDDTPDSQR